MAVNAHIPAIIYDPKRFLLIEDFEPEKITNNDAAIVAADIP